VCEHWDVTAAEPTRQELQEIIAKLREEVDRLKDEIRRIRRETHEVPPHYL
jgi:cupin superfamily acireductone dioxygenase involved in methionine salvage